MHTCYQTHSELQCLVMLFRGAFEIFAAFFLYLPHDPPLPGSQGVDVWFLYLSGEATVRPAA